MRCALIGNYGVGNVGDEALRDFFVQRFPEVDWVIFSANPEESNETARLPAGLRSLVSGRWVRTLRELRRCDGVVFGGGSLFTDVESTFACFLWWMHARVAGMLGKPTFFAFQGIGPFRGRVGQWFARDVLKRARFASVRDASSAERVKKWSLNAKVIQSFDPVFSLMVSSSSEARSTNVLIAIPRRNSSAIFQNRLKEVMHGGQYEKVFLVPMQAKDPAEHEACKCLLEAFPGMTMQPVSTLEALTERVSRASFVLSERYHGALCALALGIPFEVVSQGEGDKLSELRGFTAADAPRLRASIEAAEQALREALHAL
jgi:polysaccharide pyruvyl transferase CsaB